MKEEKQNKKKKRSEEEKKEIIGVLRVTVPAMSVCIVWLSVSLLYFVLGILPFDIPKPWLVFVLGVPVSFIVLLVFACIWYGIPQMFICVSGIIWGVFAFIRLAFSSPAVNRLIISCAVLEIMAVLGFLTAHLLVKKAKKRKERACKDYNTSGGNING